MNSQILTVVSFLIISFTQLSAQSPFKASILAGVNYAQVDGDFQTGYLHRGINVGIRGGFMVNKRLDVMSELIFQEKGVNAEKDKVYIGGKSISIDLKYAEIPLTINIHSKPNLAGFYNWTFHGGISYGRLLSSKTNINRVDSLVEPNLNQYAYKPHEWALVYGLSYNIRPHFGIRFQQSYSLSTFFTNPIPKRPSDPRYNDTSYRFFRNYFVSMQVYYDFFAPKYKVKKVKKK
jgi:hypothetical protein